MNCADVAELLPAYALGALNPEERAELEVHLATCDLHAEALALERTAARLAEVAPERDPPADLRARILEGAAARGSAAPSPEPLPIGRTGPGPTSASSWWRGPRGLAYAAAAALAILVIGFVSLNTVGDDNSDQVVRTTTSGGASATLVYSQADQSGSLSFEGLTAIERDQAYQLWAIAPGADPASLGLLDRAGDGSATTAITGVFEAGTTFAITVEPAGGSPGPTTTPLLATEL